MPLVRVETRRGLTTAEKERSVDAKRLLYKEIVTGLEDAVRIR